MQLLICIIYQLVFFWVIDVRRSVETFWKYYLLFFIAYVTSSGFGDILSIAIRKIELIMQTFPLFVVPLFMVSGLIANVKSMVFYLIGYSYLSFFKFAFQAGILIEFDDTRAQEFQNACMVRPSGCSSDSCAIIPSDKTICNPFSVYDFYEDTYWMNIMFLLILAVIFRVISSLVFYLFIADKRIPYDEMPPKDSFKVPNDLGKPLQFPRELNVSI